MRHTTDAERAALTAASVEISAGLDLLDSSNQFVEDISDDLAGGVIERSNHAAVHGTCSLQVMRELAWGRDRVRPWMSVGGTRYNLGVFVLTTPDTKRGQEPAIWDVQGYDLLHLLQDGPGDTYTVEGSPTYLQAIRDVVTASGVGATLRLDGSRQDTTVPEAKVWCLTDGGPSWLRIINDLLKEIGYRGLHVNADGELRSEPYMSPADRPIEWTLDTGDESTNIVGEERTESADAWASPNWWKFVRKGMSAKPVDGAGIYFPAVNATSGEETALGRIRRKVVYLEAADQSSLVAQGDRIVDEDRAVSRTFELTIDPLPIMGHFDVFRLIDGGVSVKCQASGWSLNLDGSPGRLTLEAVDG